MNFRQTPPPISAIRPLTLPPMRRFTLPSGMTFLFYDRCDKDIASISVIVNGGFAEAASPAIAVLTADMQREGSNSMSGAEIASHLDFNGAWIKSSPSSHHTRHSIFTLRNRLKKVLPVFADLIFHPSFPYQELTVRRETLARNIEVSRSNVAYLSRCRSEKMIMGETHPLATEDMPDDIRRITADDLKRFHAGHTGASAVTVLVCADISEYEIREIIDIFNNTALQSTPSPLRCRTFSPIAPSGREPDLIRIGNASQSSVVLTLPAIPRTHQDYLPLHMTAFALGGYFGSRLMLNIREDKGLTYGISASLQGYIDDSYIEIAAETGNSHVEQLIDEVRSELSRLSSDPCHGDELTRIRQAAQATQTAVLDSPLAITNHHATTILSGLPDGYFEAKQQAIRSLTPDIIAEMASRYLRPEFLRIAIAGNPVNI